MPRSRVWRHPPGTYELLLTLTNRHVHAQLISRSEGRVILATHSNEPTIKSQICEDGDRPSGYQTASVRAAGIVGTVFGERAKAAGVKHVSWARPGRYHGKIKAFIDNVRACGVSTLKPYPLGSGDKPDTKN